MDVDSDEVSDVDLELDLDLDQIIDRFITQVSERQPISYIMGMRINMRTMCIWPWVKDVLGYNFFMAQKWVSEHRTYITCSVNSGTLDPKLLNLDPEVGKNMGK